MVFFVNYELVKQGFATAATFPPDVACQDVIREAERMAREEEKGLWGPMPTPVSEATPTDTPRPQPTATSAPVVQPSNCHPSYPDVCLDPNTVDYDCAGGSGNGPLYVQGPIRVLPPDPFRLDGDGDGIGCE